MYSYMQEECLIFSSLMHNCATFDCCRSINALQARIGSGKHRRDALLRPLFTTVEYYRAAWR
jgi:hypothetical protein